MRVALSKVVENDWILDVLLPQFCKYLEILPVFMYACLLNVIWLFVDSKIAKRMNFRV